MQKVIFEDLGLMSYQAAWDYQRVYFKELIDVKLANRKCSETEQVINNNYLLFCEHKPVYTLGKSGSDGHLLLNEPLLKEKGIEFFRIDRGGDITFHGPGQIVGYPIFDLDQFFTDVHRFVRLLEEVIIRVLKEYHIEGVRIPKLSGVWLLNPARKICAVGIHLSRWVTMHGFAFNVNTNLSYFDYIVPCGITDKSVTSLAKELGKAVDAASVKERVRWHFKDLFGFEYA